MSKIEKKSVFNQYLEIRGRLQLNFENFNLDFLDMVSKYIQDGLKRFGFASHFQRACPYLKIKSKTLKNHFKNHV